jgi:hypothetical protein
MISEDKINKNLMALSRKMGRKGASALLSVLGKNKQFLSALDSDVGQELLKDAVNSIEGKIELILILGEKDKPKDRAELQAYLSITAKWASRLDQYNKDKERFNKNIT